MNYFVLFSVILIAACVIVLLLPPTTEGFTSATNANTSANANANAKLGAHHDRPVAAGQRNLSSAAGAADGGSSNQYLMDDLLAQQDRFVEAFENRNKTNTSNAVSSTTTKKNGIASTGASVAPKGNRADHVTVPKAGCNKDKCTLIDPNAKDAQGDLIAFGGNCVNPKYNGSDYVNYGIKYCPAFQPKDGAYDEQCQTCGYYEYKGICTKKDPNKGIDPPGFIPTPENPSNCEYESYESPDGVTAGPMPGASDDGKGDDSGNIANNGPSCSTCKLTLNDNTQCVIPGCYSADDGYLPFPDDGGYNFAEGCFYYNPDPSNPSKILPGMEGREPGYYCPPITQGNSFDGGGSTGDPCYTKQNPMPDTAKPNGPNYILDYAKFVKMGTACSNDKQKSQQNFVPGKDAPVDDNAPYPPYKGRSTQPQSASKTSATTSTINHQHHGAINVYHHLSNQTQCKGQPQPQGKGQYGNSKNSSNYNTYIDPVGDTTVLGYL